MKKNKLFGMIILAFVSANSFAQTNETHVDILLNLVGTNLNYGNANSSVKDFRKSVLGVQAGVSLEKTITPKLSFVSELYFMMKGGGLKANNPLTSNQTTLRLYTVELPVLARIYFGKFYTNAGPSLAYNISGTSKTGDLSTHMSFTNSGVAFKRFDAGIQIGGGYMFRMGQKKVTLDIRYCYGLTNISYDKEMYNRCLNVSVHFSKAR